MYFQYADDILSGKVKSCEYIKLSIKRFNEFLKRDDMYFDKEKVDDVIEFISCIEFFEGETCGEPFILQPWQQFIVANVWGFYWVKDGVITDKRVTRDVFIFMARKQGKSTLGAALALNQLMNDGENAPKVIFAANSTKQAHEIFEKSQIFSNSIDPKCKYLKIYRNWVKCKFNNGKLLVVSTDVKGIEGGNASTYILDEYHQAINNDVFNSLRLSQVARKNPLGIVITTAGDNILSPCKDFYDMSIDILQGTKKDDSFFPMVYTLDSEDLEHWDNEENFIKSNPNLEFSITTESLNGEILKSKNNPRDIVFTKTKLLNIWCSNSENWIQNEKILKCTQKIEIEDLRNKTVYVGIDLAAVSDFTAVTYMYYEDNRFHFKTQYYLPESALYDNQNSTLYQKWNREGQLIITPGDATDYDVVMNDILEIKDICQLNYLFYDSYNSTQFANNCIQNNLNMVVYSQSIGNFNRPTKEFQRLLLTDKIRIDYNEITIFCFENVRIKTDNNGNEKPSKSNKMKKIDGVIAMLQSLGGYLSVQHYDDDDMYDF